MMLVELRVRDYVLVRDLQLSFAAGVTVMSGETGAGKSLLVGALKLLLGDRADPGAVRGGAKAAYVEACFRFPEGRPRDRAPAGLDAGEDELIVAREVSAAGGSRAWIQGRRASVSALRAAMVALMDLHGQHAHQSLLRVESHRRLVDAFGKLQEQGSAVARAHREARAAHEALAQHQERLRTLEERRNLCSFQLQELNDAQLERGEEAQLESVALRLQHAEAITTAAGQSTELLAEGEPSAQELLGRTRAALERALPFDARFSEVLELLVQAEEAVEEAARALISMSEADVDKDRLDAVQGRLATLAELKRKYRMDHSGLLAHREKVAAAMSSLEAAGQDLEALEEAARQGREKLRAAAQVLTRARKAVGRSLAKRVQAELEQLGMAGAGFAVAVEPQAAEGALPSGPAGADRVEFRVAPNVGEAAGALAKIGSGGELSRLMLAIKSILADADPVPVLVFDEIDSGVGGASALKIADRLAALGRDHQVLVVTHLASIAAVADQQLRVDKVVEGERTLTRVVPVRGEERVREIARMLAGDGAADAALEHARSLLAETRERV